MLRFSGKGNKNARIYTKQKALSDNVQINGVQNKAEIERIDKTAFCVWTQ